MARLMVVEDDEVIGSMVQSALATAGHEVVWERAGAPAVARSSTATFDLVLLDLGLPDLDGVEVCRRVRALQPLAVLVMLTARRDEIDVVVGLDAGADDYLTKPFGMTELLARVRAHLRRVAVGDATSQPLRVGDLLLDVAARRCTLTGRTVELRPKEYDLLVRLARSAGEAVSREMLMSDVWDENWFGSTKTLDVTMVGLRRALDTASDVDAEDVARVPSITTLRGFGYRLDPPPGD